MAPAPSTSAQRLGPCEHGTTLKREDKTCYVGCLTAGRKSHHGLGMASGALGQARGAPALRDVKQSERPLAGAGVGCAQSQVTQVLRRLTPAREIVTQVLRRLTPAREINT